MDMNVSVGLGRMGQWRAQGVEDPGDSLPPHEVERREWEVDRSLYMEWKAGLAREPPEDIFASMTVSGCLH